MRRLPCKIQITNLRASKFMVMGIDDNYIPPLTDRFSQCRGLSLFSKPNLNHHCQTSKRPVVFRPRGPLCLLGTAALSPSPSTVSLSSLSFGPLWLPCSLFSSFWIRLNSLTFFFFAAAACRGAESGTFMLELAIPSLRPACGSFRLMPASLNLCFRDSLNVWSEGSLTVRK